VPCDGSGDCRSCVRSTEDMRRKAAYIHYSENRRRQSERAIPAVLRHVGITVEGPRFALLSLALLVLLLIVLLIGG